MRATLIIAGFCILFYVVYKTYSIANISKGLKQKIASGAVILDVRTEIEFKQGHIEGAVNIPLSCLHTPVIAFDKDQLIITCCSHGLRSIKEVDLLKSHGYYNAYNGGAWSDLEKVINEVRK